MINMSAITDRVRFEFYSFLLYEGESNGNLKYINTEGAKITYTHFKKGKGCIKIVILNLYR